MAAENNELLESLKKQHFAKHKKKQLAITRQTKKLHTIIRRCKNMKQAFTKLIEVKKKFCQKFIVVNDLLNITLNAIEQEENDVQSQGLSKETIQAFKIFTTDESHVGDQCSICMEDVDVGRIMRRLTCDGQHYFCQQCIEGWFAEHNTCPLCRHKID